MSRKQHVVGSFGRAHRALITVLSSSAAASRTVRLPTMIRINRTVHERSVDGGHFALRGNDEGEARRIITVSTATEEYQVPNEGKMKPVRLLELLTNDRSRQQSKSTSREQTRETWPIVGWFPTLPLPTLFWFVLVLVVAFQGCLVNSNPPFRVDKSRTKCQN